MTFGQRLREERKRLRLTQVEFAERVNHVLLPSEVPVDQADISVLERRHSKRSVHAPAIARALDKSLSYMLSGEVEQVGIAEPQAEYQLGKSGRHTVGWAAQPWHGRNKLSAGQQKVWGCILMHLDRIPDGPAEGLHQLLMYFGNQDSSPVASPPRATRARPPTKSNAQ